MKHLSTHISQDKSSPLPVKPAAIHAELDRRIYGLDDAKRFISTKLALHVHRAVQTAKGGSPDDKPQCILLLGRSGAGKTFLLENAAGIVKLPFLNVNSANLTAEGFVGQSVTDVFRSFLKTSAQPKLNPYAVCFFDEWDKRIEERYQDRSFSKVVQAEMLRLMDGTIMEIEDNKRTASDKPNMRFDTRGLMFVFAGAFEGLAEGHTVTRVSGFATSGSSSPEVDRDRNLRMQLVAYGMLPEFLNRITGILTLPVPTTDDMLAMIRFSNGPLAACNRNLQGLGAELVMGEETARALANYACETHTYCRGMQSILKAACDQLVYESITGQVEIEATDVKALIARQQAPVEPIRAAPPAPVETDTKTSWKQ